MFQKQISMRGASALTLLFILSQATLSSGSTAFAYYDDEFSPPASSSAGTPSGTTPSGGHRGNHYTSPIIRLDKRVVARKRVASSSSRSSSSSSQLSVPTCTPVTTSSTAETWDIVGAEGFSPNDTTSTVIALGPDNTPYMAFRDTSSKKISVMKYNGSAWVTVGSAGFSPGEVSDVALAIAPDGTPYVAYNDKTNDDKAAVKKFNGKAWVDVGNTGFSAGGIGNPLLAIGSGNVFMGYTDRANGSRTTVMQFVSSSNTWATVGTAGFSAGMVMYPSLAVNTHGAPYVAYEDGGNNYKASAMMYNGTKWVTVGAPGFSSGRVSYVSLALSPAGTPYIAYGEDTMGYKATVMMFDGKKWQPVGATLFSSGQTRHTFVAVGPDGTPYIAYGDDSDSGNQRQTVKKFNGTAWVDAGSPGFSKGQTQYNTLAFAPNGTLYVGYKDARINSKAVVKKLTVTTTTSTTSCPSSRSSTSVSSRISSISSASSSSSASSVRSVSSVASSSSSIPAILNGDVRCVQTDILNVRADSRIDAAVLRVANHGERMRVLRIAHDDWAQIITSTERGAYVWVQHLGPCSGTPASVQSSSSVKSTSSSISSSSHISSSSSSSSSSSVTMCTNLAAVALPVRSQPGMNADSILWRVLARGSVECLGIVQGYLHVRGTSGTDGYMSTTAMSIPPSFFQH